MRIVFIGASRFGLRCLRALRALPSCKTVGVVSAKKKFSISYRPDGVVNVLHADVGSYCEETGIPWTLMKSGMKDEELLNRVKAWEPDCFLVVGWYHMVPKSWRQVAPAYGLHASLLPTYSGGAPLVWSIINGEERAGITFFRFESGVDSGPMVAQKATPIHHSDTIATVYERIEDLGVGLLEENVPKLGRGEVELKIQDESRRSIYPQRSPDDGLINWESNMRSVYNFVRAQTRPYPGAFSYCRGEKVRIWKCREVTGKKGSIQEPGTITIDPEGVLVSVLDGQILVEEFSRGEDERTFSGRELIELAGREGPTSFGGTASNTSVD